MKTYHGYRLMQRDMDGGATTLECVVWVRPGGPDGRRRRLRPRLDIRNHSPSGFEWGYGGSGPAQLALALVADCCGAELAVPAVYQHVKRRLVVVLPQDHWTLTEGEVRAAVAAAVALYDPEHADGG